MIASQETRIVAPYMKEDFRFARRTLFRVERGNVGTNRKYAGNRRDFTNVLAELIDEEVFVERAVVARRVISRTFRRANRGATSDFVSGLDGTLGCVAGYLYERLHVRAKFTMFSPEDLPEKWQRDREVRVMLALRVSEEIIMRQLKVMLAAGELFYMDGEWHVKLLASSSVEVGDRVRQSYRHHRTLHRSPRRLKIDKRHFHGHPRSHRRLGPLGTVVGTP